MTADIDDRFGVAGDVVLAVIVDGFHVAVVDEPRDATVVRWLCVSRYVPERSRYETLATVEADGGADIAVETEEAEPRGLHVVLEDRPAAAFPVVPPAGRSVTVWARSLMLTVD